MSVYVPPPSAPPIPAQVRTREPPVHDDVMSRWAAAQKPFVAPALSRDGTDHAPKAAPPPAEAQSHEPPGDFVSRARKGAMSFLSGVRDKVVKALHAEEGKAAQAQPAKAGQAPPPDLPPLPPRVPGKEKADIPIGSLSLGTVSDSTAPAGTQVSARVQANFVLRDGKVGTANITATGPQVTQGSEVVSERSKTYVVKDKAGQPITNAKRARERVAEYIKYGGITTLTPEQAKEGAEYAAARASQHQQLANALPARTTLESVLVKPRSPQTPAAPNVLLSGQAAPGVFRSQIGWRGEGENKDPSPKLNLISVPNIVFEWGYKTNPNKLSGTPLKITPQPNTLFIPLTSGLPGPGYKQSFEEQALYHAVKHPAGFYPADQAYGMDPKRLDALQDPEKDDKLSQYSLLGERRDHIHHFQQAYFNASDAFNPATYSLNYRAIARRDQEMVSLFNGGAVNALGHETSTTFLGPYSWLQTHAKASLGAKGLSFHVGQQAEVGVYALNESIKLQQQKPAPADWHLYNGTIHEGRDAFNKQFAYVQKDTGLTFRSQSLVPSAGDNTAPVFLKVPAADANPALKMERVAAPGPLDQVARLFGQDTAPRVVPAESLAQALNGVAKLHPEFPELRYITPKALEEANPEAAVHFRDPITGQQRTGFKVDSWVNTDTNVSVGGPGLFINPALAQAGTNDPYR